MRRVTAICLALIWLLAPMAALAVQPNEVLADPRLEARARALSVELRCLVCQNQSIDDSNAPLARDLRLMVRERLTAGDSDTEVMRYIVARYGDFVLLRPPLKLETIALWAAPGVLLLLGAGFLLLAARRRSAVPAAAASPLSQEEKARLHAVLAGKADRDA